MLRRLIVVVPLMTVVLAGIPTSRANAVVLGPAAAAAAAVDLPSVTTSVAWVCGRYRCHWEPRWRGPVPGWAVWGPPRLPGCYYEKRRHAWVEVCVHPG
jgi:curli biogenesis system outer membrane secretion channel CsgG